jgi:uncharacterized MnhB-related membrane protein
VNPGSSPGQALDLVRGRHWSPDSLQLLEITIFILLTSLSLLIFYLKNAYQYIVAHEFKGLCMP